MKSYEPFEDWQRELGLAAAGLLRKLTVVVPLMAGASAAGLMMYLVMSGPFEFSCKSMSKPTIHRAKRIQEIPYAPAYSPEETAVRMVNPKDHAQE